MSQTESIRLTFAYEGQKLTLQSAHRLPMRSPSGMPRPSEEIAPNLIGYWVEIRDRKERTLYRRSLHQLIPNDVEVSTGDSKMPFRRERKRPSKGLIHLLVPRLDGARELRLIGQQPPADNDGRFKVSEYANIDLEKIKYTNPQPPKNR